MSRTRAVRVWIICLASVLAVGAAGCDGSDAGPAVTTSPEKPVPAKWVVEYSSPSAYSALNDVAVSADGLWVLGQETPAGTEDARDLLMHFREGKWERVAVPPEYLKGRDITNVRITATPGSAELWFFASLENKPRAWRWDGTQWSGAPAVSPLMVLGLAPDDIWAVDAAAGGVVSHWDGSRWSLTQPPVAANYLAATGPDDVWAVGYGPAKGGGVTDPKITHFDGKTWQPSPVPEYHLGKQPLPNEWSNLQTVVAASSDDVWAFGDLRDGAADTTAQDEDVVLHWNGSRWERMPKTLHTWTAAPDGEGGVVLPDAAVQRTADGQDRTIERLAPLPGPTGKVTAADKAQKLTVRGLQLVPGTKTVYGVGYVSIDNEPGFMRGIVVRFDPGRR